MVKDFLFDIWFLEDTKDFNERKLLLGRTPKGKTVVKTVIYANKEIRTALHKQALDKANRNLTLDEVGGKPIIKFLGIPIKSCSEILNTEARVQ